MIEQADIDCAGRAVPGDVCFVASALAGHVIRILEEEAEERATESHAGNFSSEPRSSKDYPNVDFALDARKPIELPYVCKQCLLDSLPAIVRHATNTAPNIRWIASWPANAESGPAFAHSNRPRVGIVGNALLCFDPFMNDGIVAFIESQGCEVAMPDSALLYTEDVRYLPQLDRFAEQGVNHVIYLQSFGCLKGHIRARGALHELARRYPGMPVTVIDYDPEASALNRENRIRLALTAAKSAFQAAR